VAPETPPGSSSSSGPTTPTSTPHFFTEDDRRTWLEDLCRRYGEEWVRAHQALLDQEWAYLQSL
jgi:hypothetical protein